MWQILTKLFTPKFSLFNKNLIIRNNEKTAFYVINNNKDFKFDISEEVIDNSKVFNVNLITDKVNTLGKFETKKDATNYINKLYFNLYNPLTSILKFLIALFLIILLAGMTLDLFKPKKTIPAFPAPMGMPNNMSPEDMKKLLEGVSGRAPAAVSGVPNQNPNQNKEKNKENELSENSPLSDSLLNNLK